MFDKIKKRLDHLRMRKTINSATTALYSEKYDFLEIESRICSGGPEVQIRGYIAIRAATGLSEPLTKKDISNYTQEYYLSLSYQTTKLFHKITQTNRSLAELNWLKMTLAILKGKAAEQANKYSIEGTIYGLQKIKKGPISASEKEEWILITKKVAEASKSVEKIELDELRKCNFKEYNIYHTTRQNFLIEDT